MSLLRLMNVNKEAIAGRRTLKITTFQRQFVFKNDIFVLPEDDPLVEKHAGDASLLMYYLRLCI